MSAKQGDSISSATDLQMPFVTRVVQSRPIALMKLTRSVVAATRGRKRSMDASMANRSARTSCGGQRDKVAPTRSRRSGVAIGTDSCGLARPGSARNASRRNTLLEPRTSRIRRERDLTATGGLVAVLKRLPDLGAWRGGREQRRCRPVRAITGSRPVSPNQSHASTTRQSAQRKRGQRIAPGQRSGAVAPSGLTWMTPLQGTVERSAQTRGMPTGRGDADSARPDTGRWHDVDAPADPQGSDQPAGSCLGC